MAAQDEFDFYSDVPLTFRVELARCSLPLGQLLALTEESVLRLPPRTGKQLDIYIGGQLAAAGELVPNASLVQVRVTQLRPAAR